MSISSKYSGVGRGLLRKRAGGELAFTEEGLAELEEMLLVGSPIEECADFFTVETKWLKEQLTGDNAPLADLYRYCQATLRRKVRKMQIDNGDVNASILKHLGTHVLGQPKDAPVVPDDPTRSVIGALPDFDMAPEMWRHQFGPPEGASTNESTIEKLRRMAALGDEAPPIEPDEQ